MLGCSRYDYYPRGLHKNENGKAINSSEKTYIVKTGDTLYSIGKRFDMNFKVLAKRNRVRRPYSIFVGQRLYITGAKPLAALTQKKEAIKAAKKNSTANKYVKRTPVYPTASHSKVKLNWPVQGTLSSRFGPRKNRMHDGIDILAKRGTSVVAAAAGKVVYSDSRLSGYGNLIIVRHSTDMFTAYAHNQKNLVKRGDMVSAGQHIANVGISGRSSGPHLHFEVRRGETAVDPLAYLPKK